jgi:hypothetical protein
MYAELPNLSVKAERGLRVAYRDTEGAGGHIVLFER